MSGKWKRAEKGAIEYVIDGQAVGYVYNGDTGSRNHPAWCWRVYTTHAGTGKRSGAAWTQRSAKESVENRVASASGEA
jgi:hypothetical protein